MKILEPYLKDPNCLTRKTGDCPEIERDGNPVAGCKAPDISLKDQEGRLF